MSAISSRKSKNRTEQKAQRRDIAPRADDPRVIRSRTAVIEAARALFLQHGYDATTVDQIAALAGVTKKTVYNNYGDKAALFQLIVAEALTFAENFARGMRTEFSGGIRVESLESALHELAQRLALGIVRAEVITLRRLLIGEARSFPSLATDYFARAPKQVMDVLAEEFAHLHANGVLRTPDARRAAAQFAYLIVGELLDRAMMTGEVPSGEEIAACARDGAETFLLRYAVPSGARHGTRRSKR